jgi:dTDP-4-amino-4,6-dideoxygalactose transaminase
VADVIGRRQLPVSSPIAPRALAVATVAALLGDSDGAGINALSMALARRFGATAVALTDSGTSALVLALQMAVAPEGTVALPAYACVDLLAAAKRAGIRVRFYDVDPLTMSPDLDSVRATLARGVDAIVAAHLYGYPADMPALRALADARGVIVIEDAAQHAAGSLGGVRLGAFGPLTILSFGRGKGITGGRGGALLATDPAWGAAVADWPSRIAAHPGGAGWGDLARAAAQWLVGRPALYGIPAAIPALQIGETVYHDAGDPAPLSAAAATLVVRALAGADVERAARARVADRLHAMLAAAHAMRLVQPIIGGISGYLRLPVLDAGRRAPLASAGVVRSYPRPLSEEPIGIELARSGEPAMLGAKTVCEQLWTLPTHRMVGSSDYAAIARWAGV